MLDAYLKCVLACIISLFSAGNSVYFAHLIPNDDLISDQELTRYFQENDSKFSYLITDLALRRVVEADPNSRGEDGQHFTLRKDAYINNSMRKLQILRWSDSNVGHRIELVMDENETSYKELVFVFQGFTKEKLAKLGDAKVTAIEDNWAVVTRSKERSDCRSGSLRRPDGSSL